MKKAIIAGSVFALIAGSAATAIGQRIGALRYREVSGDAPQVIVIRGENALQTEDSSTLKLVEYDPENGKVIYRVVQP